jgi:uncharacterized protein YecE (DUF72 family)
MKLPAGKGFRFRDLHPGVFLGTASDRYAGWIGQIYTAGRYEGRISRRSHAVGGKNFTEEVLPVDSVEEYFEHFGVLELDYTFYRPLLDGEGRPTENHFVLSGYRDRLKDGDRLLLKVPQAVFARKIRRGGEFVANPDYLDPGFFTRRFREPAVALLGPHLSGMVFEQEYQRAEERVTPGEMAANLERFFAAIPRDTRYHVELRTEAYLAEPVFEVLNRHGVGQVLSHWTWLPPLAAQFEKSGGRFLNAGKESVVRLMTPRGLRYEDAYARAFPFDRLVEGMASPGMVAETVALMRQAVDEKVRMYVIVNNRSGGNAPLTAREIAQQFTRRG